MFPIFCKFQRGCSQKENPATYFCCWALFLALDLFLALNQVTRQVFEGLGAGAEALAADLLDDSVVMTASLMNRPTIAVSEGGINWRNCPWSVVSWSERIRVHSQLTTDN